jgi:hypothetical protein
MLRAKYPNSYIYQSRIKVLRVISKDDAFSQQEGLLFGSTGI